MEDIYIDNIYLLLEAMAKDAADEYREYKQILKNKTLTKHEREYFNMRAEETLKFFKSNFFQLAFPNIGQGIIDQLRKE